MEKGIYTWFGYLLRLEESLHMIKEAGFDAIMLWWGDTLADYYGTKDELARMVRQSGLALDNIHVPYEHVNGFWSDDAAAVAGLLTVYKGYVDDCVRYGFPAMVMHPEDYGKAAGVNERGLDAFAALCSYAEKKGVCIALENTVDNAYMRSVLAHKGCEGFAFCLDTSHAHLSKDQQELMALYGDRLAYLHLSDNDASYDQHHLIGQGTVDWEAFARLLKNSGFNGRLSLEVVASSVIKKQMDAKTFLDMAYESVCWLEALIENV
jgi:sugar phosphate isomerase/epimerase